MIQTVPIIAGKSPVQGHPRKREKTTSGANVVCPRASHSATAAMQALTSVR